MNKFSLRDPEQGAKQVQGAIIGSLGISRCRSELEVLEQRLTVGTIGQLDDDVTFHHVGSFD